MIIVAFKLTEIHQFNGTPPKTDMSIFPRAAAKASIANLPELIASLLPKNGFDQVGWSFAAGDPFIAWQTEGVSSDGSQTFREGYARVRVAGKPSTVLRADVEELAWTVSLQTSGSEKFGPESIYIIPGALTHDQCFGTLVAGCSFTSDDALRGAGLKERQICQTGTSNNGANVYAVEVNGRAESLVIVEQGSGSGGNTSSLRIAPMSAREAYCKR